MKSFYPFNNAEDRETYQLIYGENLKLWPVPFQEHHINTSLGVTYVIECGRVESEPAVLMHGLMDSSMSWISNVKDLQSIRRLFLIDNIMDTGRSRPIKLPRSIRDLSGWLIEVMDGLKIRRADIIGHSYGAFISFHTAMNFPERFGRAVLLSPVGVFSNIRTGVLIKTLFSGADRIIELSLSPANLKFRVHPSIRQFAVAMKVSRPALSILPVFTGAHKVKNFQIPLLVLLGEHERIINAKRTMSFVMKRLPGAGVEIIRNAGHYVHIEDSEAVDRLIIRFLQ